MGAVAEQPSNRGERGESEAQPESETQRLGFSAVRRTDHRPLQRVPDAAKVVPAIASQPEGGLRELLLQHAGPELDHQVGLDFPGVPQTVGRSPWNGQLLTGPKLEAGAVDGKRRDARDHRKAGLLDGVDMRIANATTGREPGLVLDQLAVRFEDSL